MPPDPFLPEDAASFGNAMHGLYVSLLAGGFNDGKATELVAAVMVMLLARGGEPETAS